jgi:hypothetical protein
MAANFWLCLWAIQQIYKTNAAFLRVTKIEATFVYSSSKGQRNPPLDPKYYNQLKLRHPNTYLMHILHPGTAIMDQNLPLDLNIKLPVL